MARPTKDSRIVNQAPPRRGKEIVTAAGSWPVVVRVIWSVTGDDGKPVEQILRATAKARDADRTAYQCWVVEPGCHLQWIVWLGRRGDEGDVWPLGDPATPPLTAP